MAASALTRTPVGVRLAGIVLIADGLLALAVGALLLLMSTLFPPVAAIEGRPPVEQSWLVEALVAVVLGVAGLWGGQRALRGIRRGRFAGAAVAAFVAAVLGWSLATAESPTIEAVLVVGGLTLGHAVVALVLLAWRPDVPDGRLPAAGGEGQRA